MKKTPSFSPLCVWEKEKRNKLAVEFWPTCNILYWFWQWVNVATPIWLVGCWYMWCNHILRAKILHNVHTTYITLQMKWNIFWYTFWCPCTDQSPFDRTILQSKVGLVFMGILCNLGKYYLCIYMYIGEMFSYGYGFSCI